MTAWAAINVLIRDGKTLFEVIYQSSYRHNARRVGMFDTEAKAVEAAESAFLTDATGASFLTVQAGKYPQGQHPRGGIIAQMGREVA